MLMRTFEMRVTHSRNKGAQHVRTTTTSKPCHADGRSTASSHTTMRAVWPRPVNAESRSQLSRASTVSAAQAIPTFILDAAAAAFFFLLVCCSTRLPSLRKRFHGFEA